MEDYENYEVVEFKKALRQRVRDLGTLTEFARRSGMSIPSLSTFFSSTTIPKRSTLAKIAHGLGISVDDPAVSYRLIDDKAY